MAFTKIAAAGIGSTETVTVDGLDVINNGSFGGTLSVTGSVSVGGTLTYEDVTNVDSVGLITARNGIVVGSGITLSKDGDSFATGVTTVGSLDVSTGFLKIPDSIIHVGDSDTKIRFPDADNITGEVGGIERLRINSTGIGVTGRLSVHHSIVDTEGEFLRIGRIDLPLIRYHSIKAKHGGATANNYISFLLHNTSDTTSQSEVLRLRGDGNVGIGTDNPVSLLTLGKSANPSIGFKDYTNNARASITCGGNGQLVFTTDVDNAVASSDFVFRADSSQVAAEIVRFTSDGDVGIGTANPHAISGYKGITINHATHGGFVQFQDNGTNTSRLVGGPNAVELNTQTSIPILFKTGGDNERARITLGGQVLTGHDTASTNFHDPQTTVNRTPNIQIHGGNSVHASAALISWNSNAGSYYSNALFLAHSGSSTIGTNGIVSGSNTLGSIVFSGDDGDEFIKGAMISAHVDGTPGADDMPARLQFFTNGGSDTLTERARINATGHFFVDCTSEPIQGDSGVRLTNGSYHTFARAHNTAAVIRCFGNNGEFRTIGNGNAQNTNNSYGSLSDIELKENIVDANSQLNDIKALKIRSYNFKESTGYNTHKQIGVVAQELEASGLNGLVETNPDELYIAGDEIPDGKNIGDVKEKGYKTVKYSVLYMKAIKALQEAIAKIETLEAKVSALEG